MADPTEIDSARQQAQSLGDKARTLTGRIDPDSLRTIARCLIGVSYSADLLEKHGPTAERSHWHEVGTDAERRAAAALLRLAGRSIASHTGFGVIDGGRR